MRIPTFPSRFAMTAALLVLGLASCGGGADSADALPNAADEAGPSAADESATPGLPPVPDPPGPNAIGARIHEYEIALTRDSVAAGTITFHVLNAGSTTHMLIVRNDSTYFATQHLPPGDSAVLEAQLPPGDYNVLCAVRDEFDHISEGERRHFVVR